VTVRISVIKIMTEADGRRRTSQIGQLLSNQIESARTIRIRTQYETRR